MNSYYIDEILGFIHTINYDYKQKIWAYITIIHYKPEMCIWWLCYHQLKQTLNMSVMLGFFGLWECGSVCCVSCGLAVGEDRQTLQPSAGRNLWAAQVSVCSFMSRSRQCFQWADHVSVSSVIREDLGFRWISEQVSHHPPVSAFHAEGIQNEFMFHGSIYPKLKFWGKSVEAEPRGIITLELPVWVISSLTCVHQ